MATAVLPNHDPYTTTDDNHLEIFSLVWLDASVGGEEARHTEQKLRSIINHIKTFHDVEQCQQYIKGRSQKNRLVLVVSGRAGREIVPSIYKCRQVVSIYVYCLNKKGNEQWAHEFVKVKLH